MKTAVLLLLSSMALLSSSSSGLAIQRPTDATQQVRPRCGGYYSFSTSSSSNSCIRGGWSSIARRKMPSSSSLVVMKDSSTDSPTSGRASVDFAAIGKYGLALAMQMSLIFGIFAGVDQILARFSAVNKVPLWANAIFFYVFNLKTSIFSPLPSRREQKEWEYQKRTQPTWTPPGWVFAVMWPLFVFGIRAWTASMIVQKLGNYANSAIMALMFHLAFGSLWNTTNNVERRLGVSVIVLYGLVLTKAYAAYRFFQIDPMAGKLLAATLTWLTAAAALETRTWQINPDPDTGECEPLYPAKGKWKTRFRWES